MSDSNSDSNNLAKEKFIEADAGDGTTREEQYLHGAPLLACILSLFLNMFLVGLDQTIVSTVLTNVSNDFHSFDKASWAATGFLLPMTVLTAIWGKLSIAFGRKYLLLGATLVFEAGSLMCALSQNMNTFIGGRVIAGIGGSCIQSLCFIIVAEVVNMNLRPLIMAFFGLIMGVSIVLGPLIGGALTSGTTWRWCFYINLPIGGVAMVAFFFSFNPPLPKFNLRQKLAMIDYTGVFILAVGLTLFLLGMTFGSSRQYDWDSAAAISCLVIGGIFSILFCVWNFKLSKFPLIPWEVVKIPQLSAAVFSGFGMFSYFMVSILYLSIYFQNVLGKNALHTGISLLPFIVATSVAAISSGILVRVTSLVKPFIILGTVLIVVGTGLISMLEVDSTTSQQIGYLILGGVGNGILLQGQLVAAQLKAPKTEGGLILTTTYLMFGRNLGSTVSTILGDVVYNTSLKHILPGAVNGLKSTNPDLYQQVMSVTPDTLATSTAILGTLSEEARHFIRLQMMHSIKNVFYMGIGLAGLSFIAGLFTTNKKLPKAHEIGSAHDKDEDKELVETTEINDEKELGTSRDIDSDKV
ncbi:azole resistance protein 1 [[Candida] jaroonii]|uniref:Azole resistance protein 1 n=1 Tax=[Candida] jaroonii TaxID=467808 RepID=A0ACA9YFM8_9ASCO|nr:azole resistance protein 1 [[Candida] jaroonii]